MLQDCIRVYCLSFIKDRLQEQLVVRVSNAIIIWQSALILTPPREANFKEVKFSRFLPLGVTSDPLRFLDSLLAGSYYFSLPPVISSYLCFSAGLSVLQALFALHLPSPLLHLMGDFLIDREFQETRPHLCGSNSYWKGSDRYPGLAWKKAPRSHSPLHDRNPAGVL